MKLTGGENSQTWKPTTWKPTSWKGRGTCASVAPCLLPVLASLPAAVVQLLTLTNLVGVKGCS